MDIITDIRIAETREGSLLVQKEVTDVRTEYGQDLFDMGSAWEAVVIQKQEQE